MDARVLVCAMFVSLGSIASAQTTEQLADRILNSLDRRDGLTSLVNVSDPELAVSLASQSRFVVHAIHEDANIVNAMRQAIDRQGIYGRVSVQHSEMGRLPYAENLVNLLVVRDYGSLRRKGNYC